MKLNKKYDKFLEEEFDLLGDDHMATSFDTPIRNDAFDILDEEKISIIEKNVYNILDTLGMDLTDDSIKGTPKRVAKAWVNELFGGLNPQKMPKTSTFENKYSYNEMLVEKNITVYSTCEHHLLPIIGKAHVAYFSKGTVVGLSKMNRIVDYFAKRPQVQERLTMQVVKALQKALGTDDVACVIDAKHLCVNSRGIRDVDCSTVTAEFGGKFKEINIKREFLDYIRNESWNNFEMISNYAKDLKLYNSLTGKKEKFIPIQQSNVGMYVCGPTVYSNAHLGNCRTFISFDLIFRYLKHLGYRVRYVRNLTDVGHLENEDDTGEDKVSKKARLENLEPMEVVQKYTLDFHNILNKLNTLPPSIEPVSYTHLTLPTKRIV